MFHIIYVSTATEPMGKDALVSLLNASRSRNHRLRLTGLLLYSRQRFMQVLEGEETAVRQVWESIRLDGRHKDIDLLRCETKPHRHFPDWRMGFRNLDDNAASLEGISMFLEPGFDTSAFSDDTSDAYRLLLLFRDAHDVAYH